MIEITVACTVDSVPAFVLGAEDSGGMTLDDGTFNVYTLITTCKLLLWMPGHHYCYLQDPNILIQAY